MIIRERENDLLVVRQTEHARLCGVMSRAWGNERFHAPVPYEAVALAAAEHDNGWREWEDAPRLNPETRRPYTYTDIPIQDHLGIYRRGIARAALRDPYAGVLVSLHGSLLYARFRKGQPGADEFLVEQRNLVIRMREELRDDPEYGPYVAESCLATNRDLLFAWDALSLFICHAEAWLDTLEFPADYTCDDGPRTRVRVRSHADGVWELDPFPFREPLQLGIAGRILPADGFDDDDALRRALADARAVTLDARVVGPHR